MSDEILISDYDPSWPQVYAEEARRLVEVFGSRTRDIQHVGSTAVPELAAKPVIDIMVATDDIARDREAITADVAPLGYVSVPHDEDSERLFFRRGMPRTHHLHVVNFRSWAYWKHILFRDFLIDHPLSAEEYECLKRLLADRHRADREGYLKGKEAFIETVLWCAVKERVVVPK